jgi:hypothetical protein
VDKQEELKIEVMLKDYEVLKNYSTISSPGIRYNIISFALATIGIIISGVLFALSSGNSTHLLYTLAVNLMALLVPVFCLCIVLIWLGEEYRMMRVGKYCLQLEKEINKKLNEDVLKWEIFKRQGSVRYPEFFVIALFIGISLAFSIGGIYIIKICPADFGKFAGKFMLLSKTAVILHVIVYFLVYIFFVRKITGIEKIKYSIINSIAK